MQGRHFTKAVSCDAGGPHANRVQLEFGTWPETEAPPPNAISTLYTDLLTDELYVLPGGTTEVLPMFAVGVRTGTWRSGKFQVPEQRSFGWLRVNGPGSFSASVRVISDGVQVWSAVCAARAPTRLPPIRGRLWEVEVLGAAEITDVVLAASSEELRP